MSEWRITVELVAEMKGISPELATMRMIKILTDPEKSERIDQQEDRWTQFVTEEWSGK